MRGFISATLFASIFMTMGAYQAHAQPNKLTKGLGPKTNFHAVVFAPSPCHLMKDGKAAVCPQVMVPLKTEIVAAPIMDDKVGAAIVYILKSDPQGRLKASLPAGKYKLTLNSIEKDGAAAIPGDFELKPAMISVKALGRTHEAIKVVHKFFKSTVKIAGPGLAK